MKEGKGRGPPTLFSNALFPLTPWTHPSDRRNITIDRGGKQNGGVREKNEKERKEGPLVNCPSDGHGGKKRHQGAEEGGGEGGRGGGWLTTTLLSFSYDHEIVKREEGEEPLQSTNQLQYLYLSRQVLEERKTTGG